MDPQAFWQVFVTEADELLGDLEQGLVALEAEPGNPDPINQVFRAVHTLKGNAGMAGLEALVRFAHAVEHVLSRVRDGELTISKELVSILLRSSDSLKALIAAAEDSSSCQLGPNEERLLQELGAYAKPSEEDQAGPPEHQDGAKAPKPEAPKSRLFEVDMRFRSDLFETGQDPGLLLTELAECGEIVETVANDQGVPALSEMDPTCCYLTWTVLLRTERPRKDIEAVFVFVAEQNAISVRDVTANHPKAVDVSAADKKLGELLVEEGVLRERDVIQALDKQKRIGEVLVDLGKIQKTELDRVLSKQVAARQLRRNGSIRVETDKLDRLMNLIGEMAIAIAHVNQVVRDARATHDTRIGAVETLEQIGRELQTQVMGVRMMPIEDTFNRMRRAVRDLAQEQGKYVTLETSGTETELDKIVIEQLADPLRHMIRNCVAHGIETPAERIASRKSDTGTIALRAAQQQGHIVIEVADDGRGIDPDRVLAKAVERGLVARDAQLPEKRILDLIFLPGFSTAEKVDEVSGRGVGLDVVRKNVADLRGTIDVESGVGRGTTFRIKLPLTLAIVDGMNVRIGTETVAIPLLSVIELLSVREHPLATVEGKGEMVDVRGEYLPVARLQDLLELPGGQEKADDATVVVVENRGRKFGLIVDAVLGMDQAVIKPLRKTFSVVSALDAAFARPEGIAGATILGDGNVALILDIPGVERMAFGGA